MDLNLDKLRAGTYYILKELKSNISGNLGMALISTLTITLAMIIIGLFMISYANFKRIEAKLSSYVKVHVYLSDKLSQEEIDKLIDKIKEHPEVIDVTFIPKDKVFKRVFEGLDIKLKRKLVYNPMPNLLEVSISSSERIEDVVNYISKLKGVEDIEYWQKYFKALRKIIDALKKAFSLVTFLILVASVFIISNTIRLTILARHREIRIMQLIGAAHWFIKTPLVLEGMLISTVGSLLAILLLNLIYIRIYKWFSNTATLLSLLSPSGLYKLWITLLLGSVVIGAIGSYLSLENSLRELERKEGT